MKQVLAYRPNTSEQDILEHGMVTEPALYNTMIERYNHEPNRSAMNFYHRVYQSSDVVIDRM